MDPKVARALQQLGEGDVKPALETLEAAAAAGLSEAHFHLGQYYARQGRRRPRFQEKALAHFEALLQAHEEGNLFAEADRVYFALGTLQNTLHQDRPLAIKSYRQGLSLNPLSALGHNNLGEFLLEEGQVLGALGEFKVAIQLDPQMPAAYTNLAHVFYYHILPEDLENEYAHLNDEFGEQAPRVVARLAQELVAHSREQIYRSLYTKGHQLKNLKGIVGSRLRRLHRRVEEGTGAGLEEVEGLVKEQDQLYREWVGYLDTMHAEAIDPLLVDPARIVRRVVEAVRGQDPGVKVELRLQDGVPPIEADERLVREALTNLCFNALDAVRGTGGAVSVGLGCDEGAATVYIEVEDEGPGIEAAVLGHIFDPGFTTKEQGNGYGLSIARRIANAHHGELRVKSRPGHGTVLRMDLPVNYEVTGEPNSLGGVYV